MSFARVSSIALMAATAATQAAHPAFDRAKATHEVELVVALGLAGMPPSTRRRPSAATAPHPSLLPRA